MKMDKRLGACSEVMTKRDKRLRWLTLQRGKKAPISILEVAIIGVESSGSKISTVLKIREMASAP